MEQYFTDLNKLYLTFCPEDQLDNTIQDIRDKYSVIYNKIFVFFSENEPGKFMVTYNMDPMNVQEGSLIPGTILCHRRTETNTIYTINSLNTLISSLNNGKVDHRFNINWEDYRNSILLIRQGKLARINTKIKDIVHLPK